MLLRWNGCQSVSWSIFNLMVGTSLRPPCGPAIGASKSGFDNSTPSSRLKGMTCVPAGATDVIPEFRQFLAACFSSSSSSEGSGSRGNKNIPRRQHETKNPTLLPNTSVRDCGAHRKTKHSPAGRRANNGQTTQATMPRQQHATTQR